MTQLRAVKAWYDHRLGMVELDDDVLSIVRQVRDLYGDRVTIEVDPIQGCYHFVEHCADHTDRLIFTTTELDGMALDRLLRSDSTSRAYQDPYDAAERAQDESFAELDALNSERIKSEGERLAHALRKDGMMPDFPLPVAIPRGVDNADGDR